MTVALWFPTTCNPDDVVWKSGSSAFSHCTVPSGLMVKVYEPFLAIVLRRLRFRQRIGSSRKTRHRDVSRGGIAIGLLGVPLSGAVILHRPHLLRALILAGLRNKIAGALTGDLPFGSRQECASLHCNGSILLNCHLCGVHLAHKEAWMGMSYTSKPE